MDFFGGWWKCAEIRQYYNMQLCRYPKKHWIVCFKKVNIMCVNYTSIMLFFLKKWYRRGPQAQTLWYMKYQYWWLWNDFLSNYTICYLSLDVVVKLYFDGTLRNVFQLLLSLPGLFNQHLGKPDFVACMTDLGLFLM